MMKHAHSQSPSRKSTPILFLLLALLLSAAASASAKTINALNTQDLKIALGQVACSLPGCDPATKVAAPGDTIILTAGTDYDGPFILPNLSNPNHLYITIQSSDLSSLAEGKRVQPSDNAHMPRLIAQPLGQALDTATSASYYKLLGIEFTFLDQNGLMNDGLTVYTVVRLGQSAATTEAQQPGNIILDRCYIHGQPTRGSKNGIELNSRDTSITNSYISDIHAIGYESHAIASWNGPGPFNIVNNYLEAAGINVGFGGALPAITGNIASDIVFSRNHLTKPVSWRQPVNEQGQKWTVKALFELKSARRVTVDGNLMEYQWGDVSDAYGAINLTVNGSNDSGTWAIIEDVSITNNIIRHVGEAVRICGVNCNNTTSEQSHDLVIRNNLFDDVNETTWNHSGHWIIWTGKFDDVTISHNTVLQTHNIASLGAAPSSGLVMSDNIAYHNTYGFFGSGYYGSQALTHFFSSPAVFARNVIIGAGNNRQWYYSDANVMPDNVDTLWFPATVSGVGFTDFANGDYRLAPSSPYKGAGTDGKDSGVDMDALEAAQANRNSLSLDGVDDYVNVPATTANNLNLTGALTLEAWVKYTPNSNYQEILAKECYGTTNCGGYALQITSGGKLRMIFYTGGTGYEDIVSSQSVPSGQWVHVAGVFDGSQKRLYVGGVQDSVTVQDTTAPLSSGSTTTLKIGRRSNASQYYFKGLMDEVRISNAALYSATFTPASSLSETCGTTQGLWKFDGQSVEDATGNNNPNTLSGGATYSEDVPTGGEHALSLNGTDAYVSVANSTSLNITGALTVEAWVKYTSNSNYQNIVAKECYGTTGCGGYALQITNTGKPRMIVYRGGSSFTAVSGATTITQGVWHHVAGVFDGSEIRVYLDGVEDGSGTSQAPVSGTASLSIGRRSSTSQYYFNGLIDEVRVSAAALYDSDFTPDESPRVVCGTTKGLWKFDGQVYADNSGNGNTGTAQGAAAFSTDVP
jgi:hypothetical protein